MSVNSKMKAIADAIRGKTGSTQPLTLDDMAAAIAEIETGVGGKTANGTIIPTQEASPLYVELDFVPSAIAIWLDDYANKALDGVSKSTMGCYYKGIAVTVRTNGSGTAYGASYTETPLTDIAEDGTTLYSPYVLRPVKTGGFQVYCNYKFKTGYTYCWEAME